MVLLTFPGSPAEAAGIKSHDVFLSVEGVGFDDEEGAALDLMLGEPGTEAHFVLQSPGEEPREHDRDRVPGSTAPSRCRTKP